MKMLQGHFEELKALAQPLDTPARRKIYSDRGLSDMRYRWDLVWSLPPGVRDPLFRKYYMYLNDDHIDTALRSIVPVFTAVLQRG